MLCPICRVDISDIDIERLSAAAEPLGSVEDKGKIVISSEIQMLQKKMEKLFLKQLNSGGIIDKEAEEKRYLIVTSPVEDEAASSESSQQIGTPNCSLPRNGISRKEENKSIQRNSERNSKIKERKKRADQPTNSNVASDRIGFVNDKHNTAPPNNVNDSVNSRDMGPSENSTQSSSRNSSYRGGRYKGRRYKPRPS